MKALRKRHLRQAYVILPLLLLVITILFQCVGPTPRESIRPREFANFFDDGATAPSSATRTGHKNRAAQGAIETCDSMPAMAS